MDSLAVGILAVKRGGRAVVLMLLAAACQPNRSGEAVTVSGAFTAGPAGLQGPMGPPGPMGPSGGAAGGLVWKDAAGTIVSRVVTLVGSLVYFDASGSAWQVDPVAATVGPFDTLYGGLYATADCSGVEYVALSLPRYAYTVGYDRGVLRVLPDDPSALEGAVSGARAYAGVPGRCEPYPISSLIAPKQVVLALPRRALPAFPYVAPLHPEVT